MALARIRNFSIVAHIDHGKSTLADRLLSLTGTMDAKKAVDQVLDSMDLERERGITIKAHTVRLLYRARDGHEYTLNLIDTPGHVDDSYQGVVVYVRLTDGRVRPGTRVLLMSNGRSYDVQQVGVFSPDMRPVDELSAGQVGYLTASIKRVADAKVGETITETARPTAAPFPGYRDAKPMVFAGLYYIEDPDYEALPDALEKLRLNDPAFTYEPETSLALGYGFRCGFLGMLHMEIVQERLEREFDLSLIVTAPSVQYKVLTTGGEVRNIDTPPKLPAPDGIEQRDEPYVKSSVYVPREFMTAI